MEVLLYIDIKSLLLTLNRKFNEVNKVACYFIFHFWNLAGRVFSRPCGPIKSWKSDINKYVYWFYAKSNWIFESTVVIYPTSQFF